MKKITLFEAIRYGILKVGDIVEIDNSLLPKCDVSYVGNLSGIDEIQQFSRDNTQFYYLGTENDECLRFVATKRTDTKLKLRGNQGYRNGLGIINSICSDLFSMNTLGIFASALRSEEFWEYFLKDETAHCMRKLTSRGEAILASQGITRVEWENEPMPLIYGFKCFLGIVALVECNVEKTGELGIIPTIKIFFPEWIYYDHNKGNVARLISEKKVNNC